MDRTLREKRVRENGAIRRPPVLIAIGINDKGRRCVLGVDLANRENASSLKEFLLTSQQRGLRGVEFVVSDDHDGLRRSGAEVLPLKITGRASQSTATRNQQS